MGREGQKHEPAGHVTQRESAVLRGSQRHLVPLTLLSVIRALLESLPEAPTPTRIELRNAHAAISRAYGLPTLADAIELAWEGEPDAEL